MKRYQTIFFRASLYPLFFVIIGGYLFMALNESAHDSSPIELISYAIGFSVQVCTAVLFVTMPVFAIMMIIAFIQTWRDREIGQNVLFCIIALFFNVFAPYLFYFYLKSQAKKLDEGSPALNP